MLAGNDGIDGIVFEFSKLLTFALKAFSLHDIDVQDGSVNVEMTLWMVPIHLEISAM